MPSPINEIERSLIKARKLLLASRNSAGHWIGELSSSALSTATALCALTLVVREGGNLTNGEALLERGRRWLIGHQNDDGGWGDTTDSPTNISTTTLCWAALSMGAADGDGATALRMAEDWLRNNVGELTPNAIAETICERYGIDRTFSIPILTLCAISGRFGAGRNAWREIPRLPFELGAIPRTWYSRLGLPVVSYALPALIAIGMAQHHHNPTRNPLLRILRNGTRRKTLRVLREIQPESGGFLEAAPLTSFVAMNLLQCQPVDHPVIRKCVEFLVNTAREDGSWPIDTNLSLWVTTLSIKALAGGGQIDDALSGPDREMLLRWILDMQTKTKHAYTLAAPGGWAWTDLSGGVPDGDDTPGALLALHHLASGNGKILGPEIRVSAEAGVSWLVDLQNRDGGIPTFCRGWGKLPFDESSPDLTAHALRAWLIWRDELDSSLGKKVDAAAHRAIRYLVAAQHDDGSWIPLWFGNQAEAKQQNPLYGTTHALRIPDFPSAWHGAGHEASWSSARDKATRWLLAAQNSNGGWGGAPGLDPTIEETAHAVDTLAVLLDSPSNCVESERLRLEEAIRLGCGWLITNTDGGTRFDPAPIGLYFANLWYHEQLYPLIFTVSALTRARRHISDPTGPERFS